jgi:hypothetical protein
MGQYNHQPLSDPLQNCRFLILNPEELANTSWEPVIKNIAPSTSSSLSTEKKVMLRGWIVEIPLSVAADRGFARSHTAGAQAAGIAELSLTTAIL